MQTDEPHAVATLRSRDSEAWIALYNSLVHGTYAFLWHLTGRNRAVAEDLNQETWLSAIESIDRFDESRGSLQAWLFGIARKKGVEHLRHKKVLLGKGAPETVTPDSLVDRERANSPPAIVETSERAALVRAALEILPPERRNVLRGKYVEGLTVKQLADRFGKSPKAIESLLTRSRGELREILDSTIN
jgi:RNA polymerase sigma-70 factor (ECF subfamily)